MPPTNKNNPKGRILIAASSDPAYDRRMLRICRALQEYGYSVTFLGRLTKNPGTLQKEKFLVKRIHLGFYKGPLMYVSLNLKLFLIFLFRGYDLAYAVDTDTLAAVALASRIRKKPFFFDAHEWFSEVPELQGRKKVKHLWKKIELWFIPMAKGRITVNESLANLFEDLYQKPFGIVRNIRPKEDETVAGELEIALPEKPFFIYVGAINKGRGLAIAIRAAKETNSRLLICGDGPMLTDLKALVHALGAEDLIYFTGYLSPNILEAATKEAYAGLLLLESGSLNYYYSLANKFFDYVHAGIPQIMSELPEYQRLNEAYQIGITATYSQDKVSKAMVSLLSNSTLYNTLRQNTHRAAEELNWEQEKRKLLVYIERAMP